MGKDKKNQIAFLLSIALHAILVLLLFLRESQIPLSAQKKKDLAIEWVQLEEQPRSKDKDVQIVQQDENPINDRTPEDNYRLSKNNQDVLRETKAQKNGDFQNKKNQKEGISQASSPSSPTPKPASQQPKESKSVAKNEKVSAKQKVLNAFKPQMLDNQYSANKLAPSAAPAIQGAEISQNDDYLEDVVAGAETLLKTREFVYYSYYNRIKRKLKQHWEPMIKEKIVKILRQGRTIASTNHKLTRLVITLDKSGELVRIQVRHGSGYNDLDDAAIEAFRSAAPFPNPPEGIVSDAGEVEINWDFVLET